MASSPLPEALRRPAAATAANAATVHRRRNPFYTWFASAVRWLHIYVSLLGFTTLMFFAVTGITLNHPTWFGGDLQKFTEFTGQMETRWLTARGQPEAGESSDEPESVGDSESMEEPVDESLLLDRLSIVEHLRHSHQLRGAVSEFRTDEFECMIQFKGPAYAADVYVDRATGTYSGTLTTMGLMALMNDLHKGRDSGSAWSWVIDVSALLMVFVSVTGFILIFYLRRKRTSGVLTAVAGTVLLGLVYYLWVP